MSAYAFGICTVFHHRESWGHREAIAAACLMLFSVLSEFSVANLIPKSTSSSVRFIRTYERHNGCRKKTIRVYSPKTSARLRGGAVRELFWNTFCNFQDSSYKKRLPFLQKRIRFERYFQILKMTPSLSRCPVESPNSRIHCFTHQNKLTFTHVI